MGQPVSRLNRHNGTVRPACGARSRMTPPSASQSAGRTIAHHGQFGRRATWTHSILIACESTQARPMAPDEGSRHQHENPDDNAHECEGDANDAADLAGLRETAARRVHSPGVHFAKVPVAHDPGDDAEDHSSRQGRGCRRPESARRDAASWVALLDMPARVGREVDRRLSLCLLAHQKSPLVDFMPVRGKCRDDFADQGILSFRLPDYLLCAKPQFGDCLRRLLWFR